MSLRQRVTSCRKKGLPSVRAIKSCVSGARLGSSPSSACKSASALAGGSGLRYVAPRPEKEWSPDALAGQVAALLDVFSLLDIAEVCGRTGEDPAKVIPLYFSISERYAVDRTLLSITASTPPTSRALPQYSLRRRVSPNTNRPARNANTRSSCPTATSRRRPLSRPPTAPPRSTPCGPQRPVPPAPTDRTTSAR